LKLDIREPITKSQPSTKTKSNILKGKEIIMGGSINIPTDIRILETTTSIIKKGI